MNTTRETVEPAMRAAAEDICGEYVEVVPADTRNLMGFYVSLRRLLVEVRLQSKPPGTPLVDLICAVWCHGLCILRSPQTNP